MPDTSTDDRARWRLYHPGRRTYDLTAHADHLVPHPYDERLVYDPHCHFIAWRDDDGGRSDDGNGAHDD